MHVERGSKGDDRGYQAEGGGIHEGLLGRRAEEVVVAEVLAVEGEEDGGAKNDSERLADGLAGGA